MADPLLGTGFQAERLALIQEIARNLVGEAPPAAGPGPVNPESAVVEPGLDSTSTDALLADRLVPRSASPSAAANPLAGLRPPEAMFAEPETNRQALTRFAKSDPALAAILSQAMSPVVPPMGPAPSPKDGLPGADLSAAALADAEAAPEAGHWSDRQARPRADTEFALRPASTPQETSAPTKIAGAVKADEATRADKPDALASLETSVSDPLESTKAIVERALLSLGLGEGGADPAPMRGELGGIIASFVLNAHFQPGWPPLRPIQDAEAKAFVAELAMDPKLSKDDIAFLTYLANFGLNRKQLARIVKLVASATNPSKLLEAMAQLFANVGTLLGAVHAEIEALADEIREARAGQPRRERLTLR